MVSSRAYPSLERKPGGPDNWVEKAGGLPSYIERIAKHLHYEEGMTISRAIAVAVNTVKRWARGGTVTKHGTTQRITAKTQALAAKAVAEWEAKKKAGSLNLTDTEFLMIDLSTVGDGMAFDLLDVGAGARKVDHAILSAGNIDLSKDIMDIQVLAERANRIVDPVQRSAARAKVLELAYGEDFERVIDLASTIAPRKAKGKASDGRNSFAGQGKFKHGFIPVNQAAKEAKAKGSPIALKRMKRLFGANKVADDPRSSSREVPVSPSPIPSKVAQAKYDDRKNTTTKAAKDRVKRIGERNAEESRSRVQSATGRVGNRSSDAKRNPEGVKVNEKTHPGSESAKDVAFLRNTPINEKGNRPPKQAGTEQLEASKQSRRPKRATQNWEEIPETLKTVRNGKKYVIAEFGGKQYVTEWVGGVQENTQTALKDRKVMASLTSADAANMGQSELRALVNNPRSPQSVRKAARVALRAQGGRS